MTSSRNRRWLSLPGLTGGAVMFVAEALIVAVLAAAAWLLSVVILALL